MNAFLAIHRAAKNETCSNGRHVFATDTVPPCDSTRCECGKTTWGKDTAMKYIQFLQNNKEEPPK